MRHGGWWVDQQKPESLRVLTDFDELGVCISVVQDFSDFGGE